MSAEKPVIVAEGVVAVPSRPHDHGPVFWRTVFTGRAKECFAALRKRIGEQSAPELVKALRAAHQYTALEAEIRAGNGRWFDAEGRIAVRTAQANALLAAIGDCASIDELAQKLELAAKELATGCPPAAGGPLLALRRGGRRWILLELLVFDTVKRMVRENAARGIFTAPRKEDVAAIIESTCIFRRGQQQVAKPGWTKLEETFMRCGLDRLPGAFRRTQS